MNSTPVSAEVKEMNFFYEKELETARGYNAVRYFDEYILIQECISPFYNNISR